MKYCILLVMVFASLNSYSQELDLMRRIDRVLKSAINVDLQLQELKKSRIELLSDLRLSNHKLEYQLELNSEIQEDYRGLVDKSNDVIDSLNHFKVEEFKYRYLFNERTNQLNDANDMLSTKEWLVRGLTGLIGVLLGIMLPL